ncbi:RagB/SusD family nutrient uptake outer membrane protein [Flexithrix dorotheae]|uniref:RagB/SusD family nutrient uptake outer membrane protein n=1 Tax=Flexithrix dorotheae TaxID=70993 RepID=UPI00035C216A|nr:RagB/SusD family nutrient uptake outer membrane protein [Flexithrix dorotheae]
MKKIYKIHLILLLFCFSGTSCEDILTEEPKSFLTPGTFPANEKDATAAVNAAYSRLNSSIITWYYSFTPSDIAFQGFHNKRPSSYFTNLNSLNGDANSMWREAYEGILRTNTVISLVPDVDMDPVTRDAIIGEAKFLRAFYYFDLVRIYGGVPILDQLNNGPEDLVGITRNSVEEVYAFIKKDLTEAIPVLPDSYPADQKGRATWGAATALLGKVHLTLKEWGEAGSKFDEVIGSGNYGLFADYNSLWGIENEHVMKPDKNGNLVNENVFDIQWKQNERNGFVTSWVGSRDVDIVGAVNAPGGGWENMLPLPEYGDMFEEGDLRKEKSYVTVLDGNVLESPRTPGAGPITGKYIDYAETPKNNNNSQNTYVIRYADVLLMKAEAENELNGPGNAYQYINLVRERAGLAGLSGLTQESFRQALRKERATELGFEGHRKYDLLRWGIFVETIRNSTSPFLEIPSDNIQNFHVLMPIPNREVEISQGTITQNPGYESPE